jgi:PhzF family phenazine biosynthesis protein
MADVTQTGWSNRHGIPYAVVDVFTNEKFKGNQLAVVRQQHHDLSQEQKQAIAKEFDYSETTFIRAGPPQEGNSWYLSIFTTTQELPFAGHPVIGTAVHLLEGLAYNGETVKGAFLTRAGKIELQYDGTTRTAKAAIPHDLHIHSTACSKDELQRLQPSVGRFPASSPVVSIVKGLTFVLVELDSLDSLQFVNTTAHHVNVTLDKEWDGSFTVTYFYYRLPHADNAGIVRLRTRMIEGSLYVTPKSLFTLVLLWRFNC